MIIAITPINSRSNFFQPVLWIVCVKCYVNVFHKAFFNSEGINLFGSFFLATLLLF